jgi:hypothetical protein
MKPLLLLCVLLAGSALAQQQRYLVSPNDDYFPLKRGVTPASIMAKQSGRGPASATASCGNRFTFGYPENLYPPTVNHVARHKDVMGEWFVAKATGTIDTIFWETLGTVGALDSTLYIRVHRSNIGPTAGPGIRPGPYNPPCENWGYWSNTNDHDRGVAAFPEDATDTTWHSTYNGPVPSFRPFSNVLWGFLGVSAVDHATSINHIAMMDIGVPLNVTVGDKFFISMRVKAPDSHPIPLDDYTSWSTASFRVDPSDENYPSRNWKFYEHDSGPANCAGVAVNDVKRGWVARGGFGTNSDSLDIGALDWWYIMTVTTNVPPSVDSTEVLHNTFSTLDRTFTATIIDCDPAIPTRAGVTTALVKWFVNGVSQTDIVMSNTGGDGWEATIPGRPIGSSVTYKIYAQDSTGAFSYGPNITYGVFGFGNGFVQIDTSAGCASKSIKATGTEIDTSKFFLPAGAPTTAAKLDDGTAGPFDMGSNMPLFGDVGRYVWVGINGAIAISQAPTDTFDVNSTGSYTTQWSFPQQTRHGGRKDTANAGAGLSRIPGNFIAPFWVDLWDGDATQKCGRILHQKGFAGDTCVYIVEWDSIGSFAGMGGNPACDEVTFRVVLNKCTGVIEYQYDNVGTVGEEATTGALIGFEADSTALTVPDQALNGVPANVFVSYSGYPAETRARNGWCIKFYPATVNPAVDGWNLLSVGVTPVGGNYAKTAVYPTAVSQAFSYNGAYVSNTTLANGVGYWLKFSGAQNVGAHGPLLYAVTDNVNTGWNMVGTISFPVPKATIVVGGSASVLSNYFGYNGGYVNTNTLVPGQGYWVKSGGVGTLSMSSAGAAAAPKGVPETDLTTLNKITISAGQNQKQTLYIGAESLVKEALSMYEMPPAVDMLGFDARFASGRMVETYPAHMDAKANLEYPIHISAAKSVTVQWSMVKGADRKLVLSANGKTLAILDGVGQVTLKSEDMKDVKVTFNDKIELPKAFALSQNYPNPFNPTTRFSIELPQVTDVQVVIYDILGRQIATLVNGQETAGYHTIEWDGRDTRGITVPSGIYFARMNAGEFTQTRKIMLMK